MIPICIKETRIFMLFYRVITSSISNRRNRVILLYEIFSEIVTLDLRIIYYFGICRIPAGPGCHCKSRTGNPDVTTQLIQTSLGLFVSSFCFSLPFYLLPLSLALACVSNDPFSRRPLELSLYWAAAAALAASSLAFLFGGGSFIADCPR